MKTFRLFILAFSTFLILSCSDSGDCVQLDWVGTYTGTAVCNGDETSATATITAFGTDQIVIEYQTTTVLTTFDPITIDNCSAERSSSIPGASASLEASLDGDQLTLVEKISGGGFDSDCVVNVTRD